MSRQPMLVMIGEQASGCMPVSVGVSETYGCASDSSIVVGARMLARMSNIECNGGTSDIVDNVGRLEIQKNVETDEETSGKASSIMVDGTEYWMSGQHGQVGGMNNSKSSSIMVGGADGELTSGSSMMSDVRMPVRDTWKTIGNVGVDLDDIAKDGADGMVGGASEQGMVGGGVRQECAESRVMKKERLRQLRGCVKIIGSTETQWGLGG